MKKKMIGDIVSLNTRIDAKIKAELERAAEKRGMDLSKLTRAILTNWLYNGTFKI